MSNASLIDERTNGVFVISITPFSEDSSIDYTQKIGYIVSASGKYTCLGDDRMKYGKEAIQISESLPIVKLSTSAQDKKVFGVIAEKEEGTTRKYAMGALVSLYDKKEGDNRLIINSLGEGAVWICNINGNLENGNFTTS